MVALLLAAVLAAAPPAFDSVEPPAPAPPATEIGVVPSASSTQRYVARCEAQKGVAVMTVNQRDHLVLGCVKWRLEMVPLAEEDP